jgi:hypothetical protein
MSDLSDWPLTILILWSSYKSKPKQAGANQERSDMPGYAAISAIVVLTDLLVPITLLTVWLALRRSRVEGPAAGLPALPLGLAFAWGAAWTWVPTMAALRLLPPPAGQAAAILGTVAGLCLLLLTAPVRQFFRSARLLPLVALGPWRIVYGLALLSIGALGGLPAAFFWSAAFGDIAVGLWSLLILSRRQAVTEREILAWNLVGLVDLMHVLVLGAANLRGFYLADLVVSPLNLLPMVGVPVFIALHVLTLWGFWARRGMPRPAAQA